MKPLKDEISFCYMLSMFAHLPNTHSAADSEVSGLTSGLSLSRPVQQHFSASLSPALSPLHSICKLFQPTF